MAITRAQQAKQMLQDGGMLVKPGNGKRPGYRGSDMAGVAGDSRAANTGPKDTSGADYGGGNQGMDRSGPDDRGTAAQNRNQRNVVREGRIREVEKLIDRPNIFDKINTFNKNFIKARQKGLYNIIPNNPKRELEFLSSLRMTNPAKYNSLPQNLKDLLESTDQDFAPSFKDSPKLSFEDFDALTQFDDGAFAQYAKDRGSPGLSVSGDMSQVGLKSVRRDKLGNPIKDMFGNTLFDYAEPRDDRGDPSILLPQGIMTQAPSITEPEPEIEEDEGLRLAFRAEGGPIGGEYDFESARQMYGLGKLVKKVTRTVKKIAKSPVGKAALLYAGTAGLGALGAGAARAGSGLGIFSPTNVFSNIVSSGKNLGLLKRVTGVGKDGTEYLTRVGPLANLGIGSAILGASTLAGLLTSKQEEEAQELARGEGIDIEAARRSILNAGTSQDFRARRFVAEGGSMKEPVAKKTMPLLDMGGKEMDLREDGGFVPIGRMEKADDVPARLSKNEFVFTADAVRNAGDGDVDKGAEVMYNMMKNLEAGGDVSEESQGLEGARKMFQTSQRLEEVL